MTMNSVNIDQLVDDLVPVQRLRKRDAGFAVAAMTALAILIVSLRWGLRADILTGAPHPMVLLRAGTLLLLGSASFFAVTSSARPHVGQSSTGWYWATAAAALFPLSSMLSAFMRGTYPAEVLSAPSGPWCLGISSISAIMIGGVLTLWLRRGAPTAPRRSGLLVGLCAGSFGVFAYSLHCPSQSVHYIGLWYTTAVAICVGLGRLIVPRLIRW